MASSVKFRASRKICFPQHCQWNWTLSFKSNHISMCLVTQNESHPSHTMYFNISCTASCSTQKFVLRAASPSITVHKTDSLATINSSKPGYQKFSNNTLTAYRNIFSASTYSKTPNNVDLVFNLPTKHSVKEVRTDKLFVKGNKHLAS